MPEETIRCSLSKFQWNQPINVYGITPSQYEYINTCDISELEVALKCLPADWWESFAIELIDKPGQLIPVTNKGLMCGDYIQGVINDKLFLKQLHSSDTGEN